MRSAQHTTSSRATKGKASSKTGPTSTFALWLSLPVLITVRSGNYDNLTNGDTVWVNRTVGDADPQLTYITSGGNAIVKVDNTCESHPGS